MALNKGVFLDYNATSPILPEVKQAMFEVMEKPLNASSIHHFGRYGKKLVRYARKAILQKIGAEGQELVFTGSGTEANNLAVLGLEKVSDIFVSSIEHPSILMPAEQKDAKLIPVDHNGVVDLVSLEEMLSDLQNKKGDLARPLVSVMLANNETGVIQPIKQISDLVLQYSGFIHCDAVQALGKIDVNFNNLSIDMMSISAHKIGGPQGVGALVVKRGLHLNAQITGGGQEKGYRAGTENVAAIAGFAEAIKLSGVQSSELRDYMESEIKKHAPEVIIIAQDVDRLPNTICMAMPGISSEIQLIKYDLEGIALSSGSACSSGKVTASHVLNSMDLPDEVISSAIRVSLGKHTIKKEVDHFLTHLKIQYNNLPKDRVIAS